MKATRLLTWAFLCSVVVAALRVNASSFEVYSARFEPAEGYSTNSPLVGQNGWIGEGSGGNGIVPEIFPGEGRQAYVGFFPPNANEDYLYVWRPVNFSPTNVQEVKFSVEMAVVDSDNDNFDNFRWSVYNSVGQQLFALDFDNYWLTISYLLDGTNVLEGTGYYYEPDTIYALVVTMDFASNRWSASLEGVPIVTNQPITTIGAARNLGDVDAVWLVYAPSAPGNNFLVFDNYRITAELLPPPAPRLRLVERTPAANVLLRLEGVSGARFAIDASTNLTAWTALKTNVVTDGYFDHLDTTGTTLNRRFYRARWVP